MVAQVPTRGVTTLYSRTGYLFPVICFVTLVCLAAASFRQSYAEKIRPDIGRHVFFDSERVRHHVVAAKTTLPEQCAMRKSWARHTR